MTDPWLELVQRQAQKEVNLMSDERVLRECSHMNKDVLIPEYVPSLRLHLIGERVAQIMDEQFV